ncbi:ephrin type-B receptor [Trema orientale]|uniref:Ephrin type-B receptor n=1 Tax=Trema orientale TaxID=63057 RepID=A0A2P5FS32_TREOI|nr:ephrin type-B receptor [Trema orientale]
MASSTFPFLLLKFYVILTLLALFAVNPYLGFDTNDEFSVGVFELDAFRGDYTPPSPPPPSPPPHPPSLTCEEGLNGVGSLNTMCELNSSLSFEDDVYIEGKGSLYILPGVNLSCPLFGCSIWINVSEEFSLGRNSVIVAGLVAVNAKNANFSNGSLINVTGLAGEPPEQTSGTPTDFQGAGGGHGGRGASCVSDNTKLPDDVWGGDAYSWSSLDKPASYGSRGGTTSKEVEYGGEGGGRIWLEVNSTIDVSGGLSADGGEGGMKGGGGSGGSIYIKASRMTGSGRISAAGGNGFAGGGGGRVSISVFSRHDDTQFFLHGGRSLGCPENSGGAGTYYDAVPRILIVSNHNKSTQTDTLLMEFPKQPLWTNVYIQNHAKALVPLFWSRVQVQGQIRLTCGATLSFGLAHYASSAFELMAEELLMSDSVVKASGMIFGALRMSVKMYLMWNSKMLIDGGNDTIVATSLLEASNLVVLKESSRIHSNANLGVHGQGFLNLSGPGNLIEAQHLILSLFYGVNVGSGSFLRAPLEGAGSNDMTPRLYCSLPDCPIELIHPPEDCNVNSTLAFTIQICRVEEVVVEGTVIGSVIHFHWVRTIIIPSSGVISASGLGCTNGVGRGKMFENGLSGGGGHGGKGGNGYYNGNSIEGGDAYGDAGLPCELGSGSGNDSLAGATAGGGIIVMGSMGRSLLSLSVDGSLKADGESFGEDLAKQNSRSISKIGPGGGSGGTILLFVQTLALGDSSTISTVGGHGSPYGGGGGGGGRVHFHWSAIPAGDAYVPIASVKGNILTGGGFGRGQGHSGQNGTVTGKACPKGLYGIFCEECPVGTFKNVSGSDRALCYDCPSYGIPHRAIYVTVRGGVTETPCPYRCTSDRYHMPNCYTALEEVIYTFGGPWLFGFILLGILILLALVLSVARMKYVGADEVLETHRNEESQNHVYRMYFMGPNNFSEPWHLPHSPPQQVKEIVYEDAFNRFVDEINGLAAYQWWEGSIYSILSVLAYPLAWLWLQRCRKSKLQQLREYVRSEYDHACLRSCRSRALYEGLKVAATSDLMLAYIDFFLGGDEKRADLPPRLHQRFPISLVFGGDGSYMAPFSLQSDNILTSLMSQSIPPTKWYRLVAGLNAQLRLVRCGHLKITFSHLTTWLGTHASPTLKAYGLDVDLARFQPTASEYCQFGLVVSAAEKETMLPSLESQHISLLTGQESRAPRFDADYQLDHLRTGEHFMTHKRCFGRFLHTNSLRVLKEKKSIFYPFSFIVYNTKPVGHQDLVGLLISILLLGDFSLVFLTLLQQYSISLLSFFLVLFLLPLGLLFPFPAGISALFSQGPRRSAGLARVYALWNITSVINVVVAFICGLIHYTTHSRKKHPDFQSWNFSTDESEWWVLPSGLAVCKIIQARLIDRHVANQEIQDHSLYSNDPDVFWQS